MEAQEDISKILNPILLDFYNKKNIRSLSHEQSHELENLRTRLFFSLLPFTQVNASHIEHFLRNKSSETDSLAIQYIQYLKEISRSLDRPLSIEEQKQIKSYFYSMVYT